MLLTGYKKSDIDRGIEQYHNTPGAVLVDVRTEEEYAEGHIPGSVNIPLQSIQDIESVATDKNTPLFLYCRSGRRSGEAKSTLEEAGYVNVYNIGGIIDYSGELER
ncbi:MAG: rhodanese-like domain-containing protein [Eubacteriales bacterium]|nr:rhodanese-like domain-containing protein [Eubacteriales bacterium]